GLVTCDYDLPTPRPSQRARNPRLRAGLRGRARDPLGPPRGRAGLPQRDRRRHLGARPRRASPGRRHDPRGHGGPRRRRGGAGGYLVAGAWAAAMAAIALAWRERGGPAPARLPLPSAGTAIALLGLAVVAAALLLVPASHLHHGVFAVSAVAISAIALMLPVGLTIVLAGVTRASGAGSPPSSARPDRR